LVGRTIITIDDVVDLRGNCWIMAAKRKQTTTVEKTKEGKGEEKPPKGCNVTAEAERTADNDKRGVQMSNAREVDKRKEERICKADRK
jgi:hypothetical protein